MIVYHDNCADGFCSAWLFWKAGFRDFMAASYGDLTFEKLRASLGPIIMVDFSLPRSQIEALIAEGKVVTILDHHKTAAAELAGLPPVDLSFSKSGATFDIEKSGARLASEYLGVSANWLVDYVEDRDLWRWALPNSKEINAGIGSYPFDFLEWDRILERGADRMREEGVTVSRRNRQIIESCVKRAEERTWEGMRVAVVNTGTLISEVGNELASSYDCVICYFRGLGKWHYSLRSDGRVDVSEVCKRFGGGGHAKAAGFESKEMIF